MLSRLCNLAVVALIVGAVCVLPGLATPAHAASRALTVATYDVAPFVMSDGNVKYGFTIDLLDAIARHTGWTYTYVSSGSTKALMDAVANNEVDMGASAVSMTADRAKRFDYSQPIFDAGLQIAVSDENIEHVTPGLVGFLKLLFSQSMVVWLWAAMVLTVVPAHIIWKMERGNQQSMVSSRYFPGIFQAFGWGLGLLASAPFDAPRHWPIRTLIVLWRFVAVIFAAYYVAILTTNLTVAQIHSRITSTRDLVGKRVCTVSNTTSEEEMKRIGAGNLTAVPKIGDCLAGLEKGRFEAVVYDAPELQYYVAHEGAGIADLVGPIFKNEDYAAIFPIGSDLRRQFDAALLLVEENGEFDRLKQKWFSGQ